MFLEVASRCVNVCPLPSAVTFASPLPTVLLLPRFSSFTRLPFFFSVCPLQPRRKNNQPGPSCAARYTSCPAGIHCLQLVPRHVFDSMRTCIRANLLVHLWLSFFSFSFAGAHMCVRMQHFCTRPNTFSARFMNSRKSGSLGKPWMDTGTGRSNY